MTVQAGTINHAMKTEKRVWLLKSLMGSTSFTTIRANPSTYLTKSVVSFQFVIPLWFLFFSNKRNEINPTTVTEFTTYNKLLFNRCISQNNCGQSYINIFMHFINTGRLTSIKHQLVLS